MEDTRGGDPPMLLAVGGWMASGKSSLAAALAQRLGARLISADAVRRELHDAGREEAFVPGFSATLYPLVLRRAEEAVAAGATVVVDGTFRSSEMRGAARELADRLGVPFRFIECRASVEVCHSRLRARERARGDSGWLDMFEAFLELWEPPEELPETEHLRIDTNGPLEASLAALLAALGRPEGVPTGAAPQA